MIRRVNAVLGWEASKEINSRGRGDARKNGRASAGCDLPTHLPPKCSSRLTSSRSIIFPTPILEMTAAAAKTSSNIESIR